MVKRYSDQPDIEKRRSTGRLAFWPRILNAIDALRMFDLARRSLMNGIAMIEPIKSAGCERRA